MLYCEKTVRTKLQVMLSFWQTCDQNTEITEVEKLTKAYQRVERFLKVKGTVFIMGAYITLAKQNSTTLSLFDDKLYFRKTVKIKVGKPDIENALVCENGNLWSSQRSEPR